METESLLQELENIATRLDISVRYEDGDFKGGLCRIKEEKVIFINKKFLPERRFSVLARELSRLDLGSIYILPKLRDLIFAESSTE